MAFLLSNLTLSPEEKSQLAAHKELLQKLLRIAEEELPNHPAVELCPRQADVLNALETAFAKQSCPPKLCLLTGGLAEDDYRPPRVVDYINATDTTPRHDWRSLSPQLLRACEDSLCYLDSAAFCYVLPAYLRQYLLRPDYMCTDSIFFCLDYSRSAERLQGLTAAQRDAVERVFNEYRCREIFLRESEGEEYLLPWEHARYESVADEMSPWTFATNLALEYAARNGMLS